MQVLQDLKFIEAAMRMMSEALADNDEKRADTIIRCIQNYLNKEHHPWGFFSTIALLKGNNN